MTKSYHIESCRSVEDSFQPSSKYDGNQERLRKVHRPNNEVEQEFSSLLEERRQTLADDTIRDIDADLHLLRLQFDSVSRDALPLVLKAYTCLSSCNVQEHTAVDGCLTLSTRHTRQHWRPSSLWSPRTGSYELLFLHPAFKADSNDDFLLQLERLVDVAGTVVLVINTKKTEILTVSSDH